MAFELQKIVPWGRNLNEYKKFFCLSETDLNKKILSVADGPASFNAEMKKIGKKAVSFDPVYEFSVNEIQLRINETVELIKIETRENAANFIWKEYNNPDELFCKRINTMSLFLKDLEMGKKEGRYVTGELPVLPFKENEFDIVICSHFLFLYTALFSYQNHIQSLYEMMRVAKEARIFPLSDLNAKTSVFLEPAVFNMEQNNYQCSIIEVPYEFQKGGNKMLKI
ncbi:MAG: hypothetical protein JXB17_10045, partial [Bacteroidales bacterium]|nr:hypothetical protein [Bacteroidales bacterium]